ncbi:gda1 cd39 (nucleoside phosphatase) family protein [Cystoisospora suis]|uniref:Gda1 cd39 (Nucleoside phosphatase) family protein n=1 Tax=Cystoisospora suis TaxID=483139 RepID=A0A2C6LDY1_9APIC|nr:gda1 cd39 (nucleoside phosphatase) family protein [Cystoisospora suis]
MDDMEHLQMSGSDASGKEDSEVASEDGSGGSGEAGQAEDSDEGEATENLDPGFIQKTKKEGVASEETDSPVQTDENGMSQTAGSGAGGKDDSGEYDTRSSDLRTENTSKKANGARENPDEEHKQRLGDAFVPSFTEVEEAASHHEPEEPGTLIEHGLAAELQCHQAVQAMVVVDGGSSKTLPVLYTFVTQSCPDKGRKVLEGTIKYVAEGEKSAGVRDILETFLDRTFPVLQELVDSMVQKLMHDIIDLLNNSLDEETKLSAKVLGVPVLFYSTAGVRGFPYWFRDGMFLAIRQSVNAYPTVSGYTFFTDNVLTRPISGEQEGVYAFLTANHLLGSFDKLRQAAKSGPVTNPQKILTGIVEVGGASMQIVFPVSLTSPPPPFATVVHFQQEQYLPSSYPRVDAVAVSYMQLGASSASGVFLKGLCAKPEFLKEGVCQNPCLRKAFTQKCSAGEVTITKEGQVQVNEQPKRNRLKPVATYCGNANSEVRAKYSARMSCLAAKINPRDPLEKRLELQNCKSMVGTGDFDTCVEEVKNILIKPALALPANQEAQSTGFDTPGQIFEFISSDAPLAITGASMVFPIKTLQKLGLLRKDFKGDLKSLHTAAKEYCSAPVSVTPKSGMTVKIGTHAPMPVNNFTYEDCLRLATAAALLDAVYSGSRKPNSVTFSNTINDPETGEERGKAGWPVGAIFKHTTRRSEWSRRAYELGAAHTLQSRSTATASGSAVQR